MLIEVLKKKFNVSFIIFFGIFSIPINKVQGPQDTRWFRNASKSLCWYIAHEILSSAIKRPQKGSCSVEKVDMLGHRSDRGGEHLYKWLLCFNTGSGLAEGPRLNMYKGWSMTPLPVLPIYQAHFSKLFHAIMRLCSRKSPVFFDVKVRTGQGPCRDNLHTWGLTQTPSRDCAQRQTMNHIVDTCPLTKFENGLNLLHEADDDAVIWLESKQRLQHSRNNIWCRWFLSY